MRVPAVLLAALLLPSMPPGCKKAPARPAAMVAPDADAPPDVAAPPSDAQRSASGLAWRVLKQGGGTDKPVAASRVKIHYSGWTTDGKRFDSSRYRGVPAEYPLANLIEGWIEGVQLMSIGDRYLFWVPEKMAYRGSPGKPAGTLVFDIELLDFETPEQPPDAPIDVQGPPDDAQFLPSGLAFRVIERVDQGRRPGPRAVVDVEYTGWTTDGNRFDSTAGRAAATFPLEAIVPGLSAGIQQMVPGETFLFWIPQQLAYDGRPGAPPGMLVFQVELVDARQVPDVPDDVAAPPADATVLASGLAYRALLRGDGEAGQLRADSRVEIHYTAWKPTGEILDSTVLRGVPARVDLSRTLRGFAEGLVLMQPGDHFRFWMPAALTSMPSGQQAMNEPAVFDVEMLRTLPPEAP